MSESNNKPSIFRTSLRDWQANFQQRKALLAELKGAEEAPAEAQPPLREKKFIPRKRIKRGASIQ
jgi:hypothetical protein